MKCKQKSDLIRYIDKTTPLDAREAHKVVDILLQSIEDLLMKHGCVQLYGFGKFSIKKRKGMENGYSVKFTPSDKLKLKAKKTFMEKELEK